MDETATRRKKIDPALYSVGWEQVPESVILTEQRAYMIAPGRVERIKHSKPKKADYVLEYHGRKLAVIEAKSDEKDVSEGVAQAKEYAEMLQIRFTYATNGDRIWAVDMGVKDSKGNYIIPSTEREISVFPSPQELWRMTYPEDDYWRDRFNLLPFNRDGGRVPRYYQENAVNNVLKAVADGQKRILLTMATGTGKTYVAFQICWKLFHASWNKDGTENRKPRILFISDRNILANQARNDFDNFNEDSMVRITPEQLHKSQDKVPTSRHLYFTIFQTFMSHPKDSEVPYFMQYPPEFFDFIIIDECHRGGANDESEWRRLMDYFKPAYQLGMTATPRRIENANTYAYFGDPVYTYSLKQGISDGYLTPFRVRIAESNIDDYTYDPDDDVEGNIIKSKTYTENDFYNGRIEIRDRDEHRVIKLLEQIDPDDKTIIFCCTQRHAAIIRDMVNQHKRRPDSNYCLRVTADDGDEGENQLKLFQDNDRLRPTILTTSRKLSTGVDARNVRNIVLMRPVNNMVEFKQIIGRGTRLFDGKYYFTIYDFVGANKNFQDSEWDGDPICEICGNWPCTCKKGGDSPKGGGGPKTPPEPCPVCGHLPCTCNGGGGTPKTTITVKLSEHRKLLLRTRWHEKFQFGDELISIEEFIQRLFGRMPYFFKDENDLRTQWENPITRQALLDLLEREGFAEDKLEMMRRMLQMENCDLLDVLQYIAYETPAIERARRVELVKADWIKKWTDQQADFLNVILDYYARNGYKELASDKLSTFIDIKYHSTSDAIAALAMTPAQIKQQYLELQHELYNGAAVKAIAVNGDLHVHGNASIGTYYDY